MVGVQGEITVVIIFCRPHPGQVLHFESQHKQLIYYTWFKRSLLPFSITNSYREISDLMQLLRINSRYTDMFESSCAERYIHIRYVVDPLAETHTSYSFIQIFTEQVQPR